MKKLQVVLISITIMLLFVGCNNKNMPSEVDKISLTVSAAVSLTDALEDIKTNYEEENDVELTFNLGGSGTLAQQIQQGAPVDLFISANQEWMDTLESENLILNGTRVNVTGNNLVLIAGESSTLTYQSFDEISAEDVGQIAIGNPESVPAGKYTKEILHNLSMWDELENQLVFAKDVRQVLTYVETGNTDIGFAYESDALSSGQIKILATADKRLHEPVIYPGAVLMESKNEQAAKDFLTYIESDEAQEVLEEHGFRK